MSDRYVHAVIQRHFPPTVIDSGEHRGDYACKCGILIAGGADGEFWIAHLLQEIDDAALDLTFKALPLSHLEAHDGNVRAAWEAWKALPSSEKSRRRVAAVRGTEDVDSYYPDGGTGGSDDGVNEWTCRLSDEEIADMFRDADLDDPELAVTGAREKLITHYLRKCIMLKSVDRVWARERLMPGAIAWADEILAVINTRKREQIVRGLDDARQPRDE